MRKIQSSRGHSGYLLKCSGCHSNLKIYCPFNGQREEHTENCSTNKCFYSQTSYG